MSYGLRFRRGDTRILDALAHRVKLGEIPGNVATFEQAALSAQVGEPLVLVGADRAEAEQMAALYARLGIKRPALEQLNSK